MRVRIIQDIWLRDHLVLARGDVVSVVKMDDGYWVTDIPPGVWIGTELPLIPIEYELLGPLEQLAYEADCE